MVITSKVFQGLFLQIKEKKQSIDFHPSIGCNTLPDTEFLIDRSIYGVLSDAGRTGPIDNEPLHVEF
jgi:hypothetical protein